MNDITEFFRILAESGNVQSVHIHEGANIHDNQIENLYVGAEPPETKHHGRLSLFVTDENLLNIFIADLAVCENTADICRAVEKLSGGRVPSKYKEMDFAAVLLPYLRFSTTKSAIYQALNKIS